MSSTIIFFCSYFVTLSVKVNLYTFFPSATNFAAVPPAPFPGRGHRDVERKHTFFYVLDFHANIISNIAANCNRGRFSMLQTAILEGF